MSDQNDLNKQDKAPASTWKDRIYGMRPYALFERAVAQILIFFVSLIVLIALFKLGEDIFTLLIGRSFDPMNHEMFQTVFGGIMTLMIAMEFKHSIAAAANKVQSIIQVRTILLVAMLALARKFIIIDLSTLESSKIVGLSAAMLALGGVYWLMREPNA